MTRSQIWEVQCDFVQVRGHAGPTEGHWEIYEWEKVELVDLEKAYDKWIDLNDEISVNLELRVDFELC